MSENLYSVLGVAADSDPAVIRAAYKSLMMKYHPDRNRGTDAAKRAAQINAAFEVLSNERRRAEYDCERAREHMPIHPINGATFKAFEFWDAFPSPPIENSTGRRGVRRTAASVAGLAVLIYIGLTVASQERPASATAQPVINAVKAAEIDPESAGVGTVNDLQPAGEEPSSNQPKLSSLAYDVDLQGWTPIDPIRPLAGLVQDTYYIKEPYGADERRRIDVRKERYSPMDRGIFIGLSSSSTLEFSCDDHTSRDVISVRYTRHNLEKPLGQGDAVESSFKVIERGSLNELLFKIACV